MYRSHVQFEVLIEHPCGDIREMVGYVSLRSRDALRAGVKNVADTCIFKARGPTEHSKEKLGLSSRAIQFWGVREKR